MRCQMHSGTFATLFLKMGIQVDVSPWGLIFVAFLCLILPFSWVMAAVTSAMIHEGFHILAVYLCGGRIHRLKAGIHGAVMDTVVMPVWQQMLCILAGPAGSLLLVLTGEYFPRLALCGLVHGLYNLLPLYPLDGGRGLRCLLEELFLPETADSVCKWTEMSVIICIIGFCLWAGFIHKLGIAPVILALLTVSKARFGKISCKEGNLRVQ